MSHIWYTIGAPRVTGVVSASYNYKLRGEDKIWTDNDHKQSKVDALVTNLWSCGSRVRCFETLAIPKAAKRLVMIVKVAMHRIASPKTAESDLVQLRAYVARCGVGESRKLLGMLYVGSGHVLRVCNEIFLWLQS